MGKSSRRKHQLSQRPKLPPGQMAMSAALIDLVEPLRRDNMTLDEYQILIRLASFAWNIAQFPREERKGQMQSFFKSLLGSDLAFDEIVALGTDEEIVEEPHADMSVVQLVKSLVHRKESLFAHDRRVVADCTVTLQNGGFHITAASALAESQSQEHQ